MEDYNVVDLWKSYKELKNTDFGGMSFEEIQNIFAKKFRAILIIGQIIEVEETPPLTVYRAVVNNEENDFVDRISYPPSDKAVLNRANINGIPVFYCSENALTSILEINPQKEDIIYLGIWSGNNLTKLPIIPYLANYEGQIPHLKKLKEIILENLKSLQFFDSSYDYRKTYYEILTEFFLDENLHLSSLIAHNLLHSVRATDILIYPSIKRNRNTANFAIHRQVIDKQKLKLSKVIRFKFGDLQKDGSLNINYSTQIGIPIDNKINWSKVSDEEFKDFIKPLFKIR